jgi:hypothetical protein
MQFSEQPPAKVFQNKEFSCTILVHNQILESLHDLPDERSRSGRAPAAPASPHSSGAADGGQVPDLLALMPIEVSVVEQNGMVLSDRDYSMRQLLMDKRKGMIIVFIKIRKNSYYGRRPFVVMLRGQRQFNAMPPVFSEPIVVSAKKKKKRSKKAKVGGQPDVGAGPQQLPSFVSSSYPPSLASAGSSSSSSSSCDTVPPLPSWRPEL